MRTIYEAKEFIRSNIKRKVIIKVIGIRNKSEIIEGIICECYANIFVVDTEINKRSFSYSDVLIGNILVKLK